MAQNSEPHTGAFFGRRKGKRLRPGQETRLESDLPRLLLPPGEEGLDMAQLDGFYPFAPDRFVLEIGFGGGEHLAHRADEARSTAFIGVEPFINGMVKLLAAVEERELRNVRLWNDDASKLLPRLPAGSFDEIYLLYPDPWPKRRMRKRRFVSPENLDEIARVLKPGGTFRFASDIDDYIGWTLARIEAEPRLRWTAASADDWRKPYAGWPGTRYEAKAVREGRTPSYLTFERI